MEHGRYRRWRTGCARHRAWPISAAAHGCTMQPMQFACRRFRMKCVATQHQLWLALHTWRIADMLQQWAVFMWGAQLLRTSMADRSLIGVWPIGARGSAWRKADIMYITTHFAPQKPHRPGPCRAQHSRFLRLRLWCVELLLRKSGRHATRATQYITGYSRTNSELQSRYASRHASAVLCAIVVHKKRASR